MIDNLAPSETIHAQLALLRRRVAELEQALAERDRAEQALRSESEERLNSILESLEDIVWSQSATTFEVLFLNPAAESVYGRPVAKFLAEADLWMQVLHPEDAELAERFFATILSTGSAEVEYRIVRPDGEVRWLHDRGRLIRDAHGAPMRVDGIATDITERRRLEAERAQQQRQEEIILLQEALLRELSTPLIPISDEVVVMPLIGAIDSGRAAQVMETLLHGIAQQRTKVAILDITGVTVIDTQVASALIRIARAAKLIGAQVVLSGIRPEVAQTLVALQVDLSDIITHSTLQSSIALAMRRR